MVPLWRVLVAIVLAFELILACAGAAEKGETPKADTPLPEGALARFVAKPGETIKPIGFTPDGKKLVLWTKTAVLLGDVPTGKIKTFLQGNFYNVALSPDGKTLVTNHSEIIKGYEKRLFHYWDVMTGNKIKSFEHPAGEAYKILSVSPDGNYLAWWSGVHEFLILRDEKTSNVQLIPAHRIGTSLAFSPNEKLLAISYATNKGYVIHLWELASRQKIILPDQKGRFGVGSLTFSPDSKTLAVARGNIEFWDLEAKKISRKIHQFRADLHWLPDGHTIAGRWSQSDKVSLVVPWLIEAATGEAICCFKGHKKGVRHLCVAPRGEALASGDLEEVFVWDLQAPPEFQVKKNAELSIDQITSLWQDLDAKESARGYRSLLHLAQGGNNVVAFVRKQLKPAPAKNVQDIQKLFKGLDSESFTQREKATQTLQELGRMVQPDLEKALEGNLSQEAHQRVQKLLENLKQEHLPGELRQKRAIVVLERIGSKEAKELLQQLAAGGTWSAQTHTAQAALDRLAEWNK